MIRERGLLAIYENRVLVAKDGEGLRLKSGGIYREIFNHPPFMVLVLAGLNAFEDATAVPVHKSIRILSSAADLGTWILVFAILTRRFGSKAWAPLALLSVAPAPLTISGFHGNTDPIMMFLLVLSAHLFSGGTRRRSLGAAVFAIATGIKIVPLLLLPALFLWVCDYWVRLQILATLALFWLITAGPWLKVSPEPMIQNVFGYASGKGVWGFTNVLSFVPVIGDQMSETYARMGKRVLVASLLLISVVMNWHPQRRIAIFDQFGILFCALLLLAPGFGIQYLSWMAPWVVALPLSVAGIHLAATGLFCTVVYTVWSQGMPWHFANAVGVGTWAHRPDNAFAVIAWLSLWMVAAAYVRVTLLPMVRRRSAWNSGAIPDRYGRSA